MMKNKMMMTVVWVLVVIGALNWGLVGLGALVSPLSDWNVVNYILTDLINVSVLENLVYILVGLSGIASLAMCKKCGKGGMKGGDQGHSM